MQSVSLIGKGNWQTVTFRQENAAITHEGDACAVPHGVI